MGNWYILCFFQLLTMFNTIFGAGAASRHGSGSDQKMRLLTAPAPQHCISDIGANMRSLILILIYAKHVKL
jgi:hypothetical protein